MNFYRQPHPHTCYNTVENRMKKIGLSVYENDRTPCRGGEYAVVVDESIFINSEKLLLLPGIPARHKGEPVKHEDVTVLDMKISKVFNGDDIKHEIEASAKEAGSSSEYIINDQAHNLTNGVAKSGIAQHIDISHAMGTCLKKAYGKQADFVAFTQLPGEVIYQVLFYISPMPCPVFHFIEIPVYLVSYSFIKS